MNTQKEEADDHLVKAFQKWTGRLFRIVDRKTEIISKKGAVKI